MRSSACALTTYAVLVLAVAGCGDSEPASRASISSTPTATVEATATATPDTLPSPTPEEVAPAPTNVPIPPAAPTLSPNFPPRELPPPPPATGGTSFSIDLDPSVAGIQSTRTVGVGQQFSFDVVLQTNVPDWNHYQLVIEYDHPIEPGYGGPILSVPEGTLAAFTDSPIAAVKSGNLAPFPVPPYCSALAVISSFHDNQKGTQSIPVISAVCSVEETLGTNYSGAISQFVLRCERAESVVLRFHDRDGIADALGDTLILGPNFNSYGDRGSDATVRCA